MKTLYVLCKVGTELLYISFKMKIMLECWFWYIPTNVLFYTIMY